jgi:hypothetical protein
MYEVWKNQHKTIADSGFLIRGLTAVCTITSKSIFNQFCCGKVVFFNQRKVTKLPACLRYNRFRPDGEEANAVRLQPSV